MVKIEITRELNAPLSAVFAVCADHARFDRLPGISESERTRDGAPDVNGTGAQRRLKLGGNMIWEDIVGFERDALIEYRISRMKPDIVRHVLGRQRFSALPEGRTRVHWTSEFAVKIPVIGRFLEPKLARQFEKGFSIMLAKVEKLAATPEIAAA